jgi:branched-chain amino acid transport system ATP-binding protein
MVAPSGRGERRRRDDRVGDATRARTPTRDARALGVTIVLVEQNTRAALAVADRGCVLVEGRARLVGTAAELTGDAEVARLYLGVR